MRASGVNDAADASRESAYRRLTTPRSTLLSIRCAAPGTAKKRKAPKAPSLNALGANIRSICCLEPPNAGGGRARIYVELCPTEPTCITALSTPKSSELFGASGSAIQRVPLMMNAYSCLPAGSGTEAAHTPGAAERSSRVAPLVQALKSPTIATVVARGSTNTNRTRCTVSGAIAAGAELFCATAGAGDSLVPPTRLESATIPASPAAIASPASGDTRTTRSVRHHDALLVERDTG